MPDHFHFDAAKPLPSNPFLPTPSLGTPSAGQLLRVRVHVLDVIGPRAKRFRFAAFLAGRVLAWLEEHIFQSVPPCVSLQARVDLDDRPVLLFPPSRVHEAGGFSCALLISHEAATSIVPQPATTPSAN